MLVPLEKPTRDVSFEDSRYKTVDELTTKTILWLQSFIAFYKKLLKDAEMIEGESLHGYKTGYDLIEDLDEPDKELVRKQDYLGAAHKSIKAFLRANKGVLEELSRAKYR